jgi:hypothetical protein
LGPSLTLGPDQAACARLGTWIAARVACDRASSDSPGGSPRASHVPASDRRLASSPWPLRGHGQVWTPDLSHCDPCGVSVDGPSRTAEGAVFVGAMAVCAVFEIWSLIDGELWLGTLILLTMLPSAVHLRRLTRKPAPRASDDQGSSPMSD